MGQWKDNNHEVSIKSPCWQHRDFDLDLTGDSCGMCNSSSCNKNEKGQAVSILFLLFPTPCTPHSLQKASQCHHYPLSCLTIQSQQHHHAFFLCSCNHYSHIPPNLNSQLLPWSPLTGNWGLTVMAYLLPVCLYGIGFKLKICIVSGTSHDGGYSHDAVVFALKNCGYRHIDTAKRYGCERYIAQAVKVRF